MGNGSVEFAKTPEQIEKGRCSKEVPYKSLASQDFSSQKGQFAAEVVTLHMQVANGNQ